MGIFDFLRGVDINKGVIEYRETEGAVLLDVRTPEEYSGDGHIPGSRNVPLQNLREVAQAVPDKHTPLFVYCYSGGRSSRAVHLLESMGYTSVKNLGGIVAYQGKVEK